MKNTIYSGELYNPEIKERFLSKYKENTQKTLKRIFKASYYSEKDLDKDLYAFSRDELRSFFYFLKPLKFNSSKQNGHLVKHYIDWAIEQGIKKGVNPLDGLSPEWYKQFVDAESKQYFTEDELNYVVDHCHNAQDAVIVQLIMEGVLGESCEELLNLRKDDIDFQNNVLSLTDDINKKSRKIKVSDKCIRLCKQALNETEYEKLNGEASPDVRSPVVKLVDNDYVIKSALTNTKSFGKATKNIIHRRLDVLSNYFKLPNFTPKNIHYSGMLIMAKNLYLQRGNLDKNEYDMILDTFGIKNLVTNESQVFNAMRQEFLNIEKIKELYKI